MMHDEAVLSLSFSKDSELLVSGSQDGKIKVGEWQTANNALLNNNTLHAEHFCCWAVPGLTHLRCVGSVYAAKAEHTGCHVAGQLDRQCTVRWHMSVSTPACCLSAYC